MRRSANGMRGVRKAFVVAFILVVPALPAQTTTSASIRGHVRIDVGPASGAEVTVTDLTGGRSVHTVVRDGWFAVQGLEVARPYSVIVRQLGYQPAGARNVVLSLGEDKYFHFTLQRLDRNLDTVWVAPTLARGGVAAGAGMSVSAMELQSLPSLDRDFYDFLRLSPFTAARSARSGFSAGGVSARYNNFLIDGISDRGLLGNFSAGTGQGAKAISIEAVQEYQYLVSPFDPRYGDFAGGVVSAVTKAGTNTLKGSVFGFTRSGKMARQTEFLVRSQYERQQYGVSLGGPLIRNRAHFFVAVEKQRLVAPAKGPYLDGPSSLPVRDEDISEFSRILTSYGLAAGSAGKVRVENPLDNAFGRLDVSLPKLQSRTVLWYNYAAADNSAFTREASTSFFTRGAVTFPLSSLKLTSIARKSVTAAQVFTTPGNSALNEFVVAIKRQPNWAVPMTRAPLVSVAVPRADGSGRAYLEAGSAEAGHGIGTEQESAELADNITLTHRAGALSAGIHVESFSIDARGQPGAYGSWLFSSLDSLSRGEAERFRITRRVADPTPVGGRQYGAYLGEKLRLGDGLTVLFGLRADVLLLTGHPPYSAAADSLYERNTAMAPGVRIDWSPRLGFDWSAGSGAQRGVRGGIGVFVGRPPLAWLGQRLVNTGGGTANLLCIGSRADDPAAPPPFVPDHRHQPDTCAGGIDGRTTVGGPLNLIERRAGLARALKTDIAIVRALGAGMSASVEALVTRNLTDFAFVNLNLLDARLPLGSELRDKHGRVLYGTLDATLRARPRLVSSRFSEVIELARQSRNRSYQIVLKVDRHSGTRVHWNAAYAFSKVRDVQTIPSQFAYNENWQAGRVVSGRHDVLERSTSSLEIPHRVVFSAIYGFRRGKRATDFSLYYIGESGQPFTYLASAGQGRGDLNADGTNLNDPVYVPRSSADTAEILFAGTPDDISVQQQAFERLIESRDCLSRQRGTIMKRNSCRAPWVNLTSASLRHTLAVGGHAITLQLDAFNLLNLFSPRLGKVPLIPSGANFPLLEHVGQTPGPMTVSQSVFRFDPAWATWSTDNVESAFQLQLGARYRF